MSKDYKTEKDKTRSTEGGPKTSEKNQHNQQYPNVEALLKERKVKKQVEAEVQRQKEIREAKSREWESTKNKKRVFLDIYSKTMGSITTACKNADIDRGTYYKWVKKDPDFADEIHRINDSRIETAESEMYKLVLKGDGPTIRWYLSKTSDKYADKKILEHHVGDKTFEDVIDQLLEATRDLYAGPPIKKKIDEDKRPELPNGNADN